MNAIDLYLGLLASCAYLICTVSKNSIYHQLSLEIKNKLELLQVDKQIKIFKTKSWQELINQFKEINLYFSERMLGLILASIVNVKVSPYEVSNKIRVFKNESRDMKIDEAVSIIKNSLKTISNDR